MKCYCVGSKWHAAPLGLPRSNLCTVNSLADIVNGMRHSQSNVLVTEWSHTSTACWSIALLKILDIGLDWLLQLQQVYFAFYTWNTTLRDSVMDRPCVYCCTFPLSEEGAVNTQHTYLTVE